MTLNNYSAIFRTYHDDIPKEYIAHQIEKLEMEALHRAVKQTEGWICVKLNHDKLKEMDAINYIVTVDVKPVQTVNPKIYIFEDGYQRAMLKNPSLPRDLFYCSWCGGHTKNDMRGHCSGCGGPRNNKYLDNA